MFVVTVGYRTPENAGETNLILFNTFRRMFAPTVKRLQQWGFPQGLKELKWIGYPSWESVILNLLMLVPLGYLVPICFQKIDYWIKMMFIGFMVSLLIETAQLIFHRGWFDVDDLFLNTLGALIGWCLFKRVIDRKEKTVEANNITN